MVNSPVGCFNNWRGFCFSNNMSIMLERSSIVKIKVLVLRHFYLNYYRGSEGVIYGENQLIGQCF